MFVGILGYAYEAGVQVVWFQLSWVLGDITAWLFLYKRVRERSGRLHAGPCRACSPLATTAVSTAHCYWQAAY